MSPYEQPFAALAAASDPSYDEMLIAIEREFRAVHREAVAARIDELALPLFGLGEGRPDDQALALARAAWMALPDEGDHPSAWLLGCALESGASTGVVRAALACELGRRAGVRATAVQLHGCWAIHLSDRSGGLAADLGSDPAGDGAAGGVCAHQLAFAVLSGLKAAWLAVGDRPRATRACGLRLLLPLSDALRSRVRFEVENRWAE
jgi:hypothetical protein